MMRVIYWILSIIICFMCISCHPIPEEIEKITYFEDFEENDEDWSTRDYDYNRYGGLYSTDHNKSQYPYIQVDYVHNGKYAVQFGSINSNEYSSFSMDVNLTDDYTLSFFYKVSSEKYFDRLLLIIDGNDPADAIWKASGEVGWKEYKGSIDRGRHTITWMYHKNGASTSSGHDTAWIDDISIQPKYYLNVACIGNGEVVQRVGGNVSLGPYASGTIVKLEAIPAGGEEFKNWGGSISGHSLKTYLEMDSDKTVIARFTGETKVFEWVIMMYAGGDNDLEEPIWQDVNEMEHGLYKLDADVLKTVKVLVLWDGIPGYETNSPEDTKLYELGPDGYNNKTLSDRTIDLTESDKWWSDNEIDMTLENNLMEFVKWASNKYPHSKHKMLVLSDHGGGPRSKNNNHTKGAIWDNTDGGWEYLKTKEIKNAISQAGFSGSNKLDILGFDACLMASVEEAYEHKDVAKYYVASLNNEQNGGWKYDDWISRIQFGMSSPVLGREIVKSYRDHWVIDGVHGTQTLSCTDLSEVEILKESIDNLAKVIMDTGEPLSYRHYLDSPPTGPKITYSYFKGLWAYLYEIGAFVDRISGSGSATFNVKRAARQVKDAMKTAIVYSWADYKSDDYYGYGFSTGKGLSIMGTPNHENTISYDPSVFAFADGDWATLYNIWYP